MQKAREKREREKNEQNCLVLYAKPVTHFFKKSVSSSNSAFYDVTCSLTNTYMYIKRERVRQKSRKGRRTSTDKRLCCVFSWMLCVYLHIIYIRWIGSNFKDFLKPSNCIKRYDTIKKIESEINKLKRIELFRDLIGKGWRMRKKKVLVNKKVNDEYLRVEKTAHSRDYKVQVLEMHLNGHFFMYDSMVK